MILIYSCSNHEQEVDYYEDGSKKSITNYSNGDINGKRKEFFQNGELKSTVPYKDGVIDGDLFSYYKNGNIESTGSYKNGYIHGEVKHFYENGILNDISEWRENKRHGVNKIFYENSRLMYEARFNMGERVDTSYFYYENGSVKEEKIYTNNEIAYFKIFNEKGQVEYDIIEPGVRFDNDTVKLGNKLLLLLDIRYDLKGKVSVDIGRYNEIADVFVSDTSIIRDKRSTMIQYSFQPIEIGNASLDVKFNHVDKIDAVSVDNVIKRLEYTVIQ